MANKSKAKGSAYETKIKELLKTELGLPFERTPMSGTLHYAKGDLWIPSNNSLFPYTMEMKHYADLEWNNLLTAKSTDILEFWRQAKREAEQMQKKPLLIFRWNRSKDYAGWDDELSVPHHMNINAFDCSFKVALLSDWIKEYKKSIKI